MDGDRDLCSPEQFSDPDVTGIGVFISFGISTLLTIGSIVVAYLLGAVPSNRYNAADNALLNILYGLFRARRTWGTHDETDHPQRTAAFEAFIQSMGDQQLFTGLALIVAVYMIRYGVTGLDVNVSAYSFCIAVNLALLSCLTHLSSMTVLQTHYTEFKRLRNVRVAMMIIAAALIMPQLVASQVINSSTSLRCALDDPTQGPWLRWNDHVYDQTVYFATLGIIGVLMCGYLRRSLAIYFPTFRVSPEAWVAETFAAVFHWPTEHALQKLNTEAARHEAALALELSHAGISWRSRGHASIWLLLLVIYSALRNSFLAEILWLLFYFTFAATNIIFFIVWSPTLESDTVITLTLGFGQILPLILLGLPVLSALDLYAGLQKNRKKAAHDVSENRDGLAAMDFPAVDPNASQPMLVSQTHGQRDISAPDHVNLYEVCMQHHPKTTKTATLFLAAFYAASVALSSVVFSGIIWSGDTQLDNEHRLWAGYILTLITFVFFLLALLGAVVRTVSWTWQGRYSRPVG